MALCEKILIVGFTGAGKTSFLREVEFQGPPGWELFDDLDSLVLKNAKIKYPTIAALVGAEGWEKFRLWERQSIEAWLKEEGKGVLALGGGALSPLLYDLLKPSRKLKFLYLEADFKTCFERLKLDSVERPLLKMGEQHLRNLFEERHKIFDQIPWKVSNSGRADLTELARNFWKEVEPSSFAIQN
jgi:shikimate kinase